MRILCNLPLRDPRSLVSYRDLGSGSVCMCSVDSHLWHCSGSMSHAPRCPQGWKGSRSYGLSISSLPARPRRTLLPPCPQCSTIFDERERSRQGIVITDDNRRQRLQALAPVAIATCLHQAETSTVCEQHCISRLRRYKANKSFPDTLWLPRMLTAKVLAVARVCVTELVVVCEDVIDDVVESVL